MKNFYYQREGESVQEAFTRWHNEINEKWNRERDEARRERELEERLYKRLLDQIMRNITVEVKDEASPVIKQLKQEINALMK